ncbi:MAG: class IIb bacteriocin, lactobin A/cerein 7B family [Bacilli bacterium]|nr:class IIb bacteriocin, lactobin A/cerein 7B family [Bacilli bacterium]
MELNKEQLMKVNGGISGWAVAGIIGGIVFIIGVIDGYVRPLACN